MKPGKPARISGRTVRCNCAKGRRQSPPCPMPQDALDLFRLLAERRAPYLLAGGLAMLTYVNGRNTKDVDLLMSLETSREIPELEMRDRQDFFARAQFRSVQVDLLSLSIRFSKSSPKSLPQNIALPNWRFRR